MYRKALYISAIYLLFLNLTFRANKTDSLLVVLDKVCIQEKEFDLHKDQKIEELKIALNQASTENIHDIYLQIFREYESYIFDSAMVYVQKHLKLSESENNTGMVNECKMQLARMYSTFARFSEAIDMMNSVDRRNLNPEQMGDYYNAYAEVYAYWAEYSLDEDRIKYISLRDTYHDSALMVLPRDTYSYSINYGRWCIEMYNFKEAENILLPHLSTIEPNTRDYAILTSLVAHLYKAKGDVDKQKEFFARSAIADIEASVKENTSLGLLAFLLFNEGDMSRANRYIKKSLEDANFYNARLRNVQISKVLPVIDTAYQLERENHRKKQRIAIVVIGILSIFLAGVVFVLIQQMKSLANARQEVIEANEELKRTNAYLSETNQIKEEYIGRFLNQCSEYINKMEKYRKLVITKVSARKLDELHDFLKSTKLIDIELKEFYQNFDSTFLNLFPDFVQQFNRLLPDEDKIIPKSDTGLTAELRIFALIRLGITDSDKIADFLRYSITTIYNYRSKYRNKAQVPNDKFEEIVMNL